MNRWLPLSTALLLALASSGSGEDDVSARIAGLALTRGGAYEFLERLTDSVGGRVTGSSEARVAEDLLLASLKEASLANVHAEDWPLASRWTRGYAKGRIVSPIDRTILIGSHGWTPGTPGPVEAPLLDLGAIESDDLKMPAEKLRGAIVLAEFKKLGDVPAFMFRAKTARKLADAGAAALVIGSEKSGRMLDIGCFGNYPKAALPMLSLAKEDALLLRRLLAKGPVRLSLDVQNNFDEKPGVERNLIAEIPGHALADEVVVVGGHLDSWDPGQGAQDDGSGIAAVLEAARVLKAIGVQPKRTIRFVFWSGEEQAILGSQAYVEAHRGELDRIRAALVMDNGAEVPHGFHTQGRTDLDAALQKALAPLAAIGADGLSHDASFDQDHAFFVAAGVPALTLWVDEGGYDTLHHAPTDTLDKVDKRALALDTAVMAVAAWRIANADQPLGRRLSEAEAMELLKKNGLDSAYKLASQRK